MSDSSGDVIYAFHGAVCEDAHYEFKEGELRVRFQSSFTDLVNVQYLKLRRPATDVRILYQRQIYTGPLSGPSQIGKSVFVPKGRRDRWEHRLLWALYKKQRLNLMEFELLRGQQGRGQIIRLLPLSQLI